MENENGDPIYLPDTVVRIYGLIDPRTGLIRYIGRTKKTLRQRLATHLKDAATDPPTNHRIRWFKKLISLGLTPIPFLIEECRGNGCLEEKFHIRLARADGMNIVNSNDGSDGPMWICDETRQKLSRAAKGRRHRPESIAKMLANRVHTAEQREQARRLGKTRKGWVPTPETREKMSAAKRKKPLHANLIKSLHARKGKGWTVVQRESWEKRKALQPPKPPKPTPLIYSTGRKRKPFTADESVAIGEEYKAGGITKQIAAKWGTTHYTITEILRNLGIPARPHSLLPHQIEKMRKSKMGKKQNPEHVEARISKIRGVPRGPFTEEHKQKLSEAHKGKVQSQELIDKRLAATRERNGTLEERLKVAAQINELKAAMGWSYRELAEFLGESLRMIKRIGATGELVPTLPTLQRIYLTLSEKIVK